MVAQRREDRVRDRPDPCLDRGSVRDALGHEGRDAIVELGGCRWDHLDQGVVGLAPSDDLADVHLVSPEGAGHAWVGLQEEPSSPDERGDVVRVQPEAEVSVAVGRRRCRDDQWIGGAGSEDRAHLAEVVRDQVERALSEAWPRDVREEVRDVTKTITECSVEVGPIVKHVHLVHVHPVEPVGGCLDSVEHRHWLAVRERHDQVGSAADVLKHGIGGCGCDLGAHSCNVGRSASARKPVTRCSHSVRCVANPWVWPVSGTSHT